MRLDLSVNILTNHAVNNSKITVLGGGEQKDQIWMLEICVEHTKLS